MGCFKRKTSEYFQEQADRDSIQNENDAPKTPVASNETTTVLETDEKSNPAPENKTLLDNDEANGSPVKEKDPDLCQIVNVPQVEYYNGKPVVMKLSI